MTLLKHKANKTQPDASMRTKDAIPEQEPSTLHDRGRPASERRASSDSDIHADILDDERRDTFDDDSVPSSMEKMIESREFRHKYNPSLTSLEGEPVRCDGILNKWTNYAGGYKRRYFLLEDGVISYYKNLFEYPTHCRGSFQVKDCKLYVNTTDKLRFDIVCSCAGSGGDLNNRRASSAGLRYHLKADNSEDLHRWLYNFDQAQRFEEAKTKAERLTKRGSHAFSQFYTSNPSAATSSHKHATDDYSSTEDFTRYSSSEEEQEGPFLTKSSRNLYQHTEFVEEMAVVNKLLDDLEAMVSSSGGPFADYSGTKAPKSAGSAEGKHRKSLFSRPSRATQEYMSRSSSIGSFSIETDFTKQDPMDMVLALKSFLASVKKREKMFIYRINNDRVKIAKLQETLKGSVVSNEKLERSILEERYLKDDLLRKLESILVTSSLGSETRKSISGLIEEFHALKTSQEEEDEFFDAVDVFETPLEAKIRKSTLLNPEEKAALDKMLHNELLLSPEKVVSKVKRESKEIAPEFGDFLGAALQGYPEQQRQSLPVEMVVDAASVSIWTVLKSAIGKDMTRISIPIHYNEPLSMLQRLAEDMEYSECLDNAAAAQDSLMRIQFIAAFAVSVYASTWGRVSKPFNPLLHETFELVSKEKGFRYLAEQVSHHPPITACYCESSEWIYWSEVNVKTAFWGKSFDIQPLGVFHVVLKKWKEHYSWRKCNTVVNNIVLGKLWIDHYGQMTVLNHKTGDTAKLDFNKTGWRTSSKDSRKVTGKIYNGDNDALYEVFGKWTDNLTSKKLDKSRGGGQEEVILWEASPRPACSPAMYNFTSFSMQMNELNPDLAKKLCPSDSRFRPDQRAMEEGDLEAGVALKDKLEDWQRKRRNIYKATPNSVAQPGVVDLEGDGLAPFWFTREIEDDTNDEHWVYKGGYWEQRENEAWSEIPRIYDEPVATGSIKSMTKSPTPS